MKKRIFLLLTTLATIVFGVLNVIDSAEKVNENDEAIISLKSIPSPIINWEVERLDYNINSYILAPTTGYYDFYDIFRPALNQIDTFTFMLPDSNRYTDLRDMQRFFNEWPQHFERRIYFYLTVRGYFNIEGYHVNEGWASVDQEGIMINGVLQSINHSISIETTPMPNDSHPHGTYEPTILQYNPNSIIEVCSCEAHWVEDFFRPLFNQTGRFRFRLPNSEIYSNLNMMPWGLQKWTTTFHKIVIYNTESGFFTINGRVSNIDYVEIRHDGVYNNNQRIDPNVQIFIEENSAPVFTGSSFNLITSVDNPIPVETIISGFTLIDDLEGVLGRDNIFIYEDTTYFAQRTLGTFQLMLEGWDSSYNTTLITINITVVDLVAPTITLREELRFNLTDDIDFTIIEHMLDINDNYNTRSQLVISYSDYDFNKVGTSSITVKVNDRSGNYTIETFQLILIDNIAPTLRKKPTAPIKVSYETGIAKGYILNLVEIVDEHSQLTKTLIDNIEGYFYNKNRLGTYTEIVRGEDEFGNYLEVDVIIEVIDIKPPLFVVNDKIFLVEGEKLTIKQLENILKQSGFIVNSSDLIITEDTYSTSADGIGIIKLMNLETQEEYSYSIETLTEETKVEYIDTEIQHASFFDLIKAWFNRVINAIGNHLQEYSTIYIVSVCVLVGLVGISVVIKKKEK